MAKSPRRHAAWTMDSPNLLQALGWSPVARRERAVVVSEEQMALMRERL